MPDKGGEAGGDCPVGGRERGKYPRSPETRAKVSANRMRAYAAQTAHISETEVRRLYDGGLTQVEIAQRLGETQKVIWRYMRHRGITARRAIPRNQSGPKSTSWKGDGATYSSLHLRVQVARGRPSLCDHCRSTTAKRYEWANVSGKYADLNDYIRLCKSCHVRFDNSRRRKGGAA
jgi:hypothetical protein